jgi:polyisoprenoid-binding protein YceI
MTTAGTATQRTTQWQIDPAHTEVEFAVRHLMISTVKGRFGQVTGTLTFDERDSSSLELDVTIPVATVDTREEKRDAHLRSPDFFSAEQYPVMTFRSRRVEGNPFARFRVIGDLTIRGVTRPVVLDAALEGRGNDPWGNERLGYSASGRISRTDFGLTWNMALETGGVLVGDEVRIAINAELSRPAVQSKAA